MKRTEMRRWSARGKCDAGHRWTKSKPFEPCPICAELHAERHRNALGDVTIANSATEARRVVGNSAPPSVETFAPQPKGIRGGNGSGRLPRATPAQVERWKRLIEHVGCIACRREGQDPWGRAIEIHHVLDGNRRIGHDETIPLHAVGCHQNGTSERPARHPMQGGRVLFERRVGVTEFVLLDESNAIINREQAA